MYLQTRVSSMAVQKTPFELWSGRKLSLRHLYILQEKTKIVTEISVTIPSQIMFSDEFVMEFSSSQYWSSQYFVTEKNSVTKFCD